MRHGESSPAACSRTTVRCCQLCPRQVTEQRTGLQTLLAVAVHADDSYLPVGHAPPHCNIEQRGARQRGAPPQFAARRRLPTRPAGNITPAKRIPAARVSRTVLQIPNLRYSPAAHVAHAVEGGSSAKQ